jgi:hypothetical protein
MEMLRMMEEVIVLITMEKITVDLLVNQFNTVIIVAQKRTML